MLSVAELAEGPQEQHPTVEAPPSEDQQVAVQSTAYTQEQEDALVDWYCENPLLYDKRCVD